MNLGQLIETLAAAPSNLRVRFDNGDRPQKFYSWRGSYDELTLHESFGKWDPETGMSTPDPSITVKQLLAAARKADGATFQGYKGGDFKMDVHTPVWADPYGEYLSHAITGTRVEGDDLILVTADISEYR
jgi:hypothetical protein